MHIDTLLSTENIYAYAQACLEVGKSMAVLLEEGQKNILIPSRGAYPMFYFGERLLCNHFRKGDDYNLFVLPFTSDFFSGNEDSEQLRMIRQSWVKTYQELLSWSKTRELGDRLSLYHYLLQDIVRVPSVEPGPPDHHLLRNLHEGSLFPVNPGLGFYFPDVHMHPKQTIFLDTVISGKSAATILKAFDEQGIDFFALLICDEDGKKIKPEHQRYFDELRYERGKAELITVPTLFTEDTSPVLMGITSVVFPGLIKAIRRKGIYESTQGVGVWLDPRLAHHSHQGELEAIQYNGTQYNVSFVVQVAMDHLLKNKIDATRHSFEVQPGIFDYNWLADIGNGLFRSFVETGGFLDPMKTLDLYTGAFDSFAYHPDDVSVTGAHVLKVEFSDSITRRIVDDITARYH